MKDISVYNSPQIKSFDSSDNAFKNGSKLIRYHYTSPSSFLSILRSNDETATLRFTDARYMNDKSELIVVAKALYEFFKEHEGEYPCSKEVADKLLLNHKQREEDYLNLKINNIEFSEIDNLPFGKTKHFIFCLCNKKDSLHMWNYYTKNGRYQGYSLGFDIYSFVKSFDSSKATQADAFLIRYGNVLYTKEKQHIEIKTILDNIEKMKNVNMEEKMIYLRINMELSAPFFKDESFKTEEEYRIVFSVSDHIVNRSKKETEDKKNTYFNENLKKVRFDYDERNGVLVPYMEVPVIKKALKQVVIAPMVEESIARDSLKEFLYANEYSDVEIIMSKVPIRF